LYNPEIVIDISASIMNISLRQLRAFLVVAELESFTAAAQRLHLTQAALSGLVKELEQQLGVTLLDRTTRKVELSEVGKEFYPLAERVAQDADNAIQSITTLKEKRRGVIRIAAPELPACTFVPDAIATFLRMYPGTDVRLTDTSAAQVVAKVRNGEVDIGVGIERLADTELESHPLLKSPMMLFCRKDDQLARKRRAAWKDLRPYRLIYNIRNFRVRALGEHAVRAAELLPEDMYEVDRLTTAFGMVRFGLGVTVAPAIAEAFGKGFGLAMLPLQAPQLMREFTAYTRRGRSLSPAAEEFLSRFLGQPDTSSNGRQQSSVPMA
jgi:DNA-binding transcriptional LysR family regulator